MLLRCKKNYYGVRLMGDTMLHMGRYYECVDATDGWIPEYEICVDGLKWYASIDYFNTLEETKQFLRNEKIDEICN